MSRVEKPKDISNIANDHGSAVFELLSKYRAVDDKGRYLHWNEFKRRVPSTVNREAAWGAVKLARMSMLKSIELVSESGKPFEFCIPDICLKTLHEVEQLNGKIAAMGSQTAAAQNQRYLVDSLMMEEAISSAQLEGAATTRKVAKDMLSSERPPKTEDERMILNNYRLMRQAKFEKDNPLTVDLICLFHQIATVGVKEDEVRPGEIRETDDIYVVGADDDIAHQPPKAVLLNKRLQALCEFANGLHDGADGRPFIHPAVKAIILHFMLGYEHPFVDGNGRTARCLFYWYMLKSGYWVFEYISISSLLKEAPVQYGESYLYTETDNFDLTYFIVYQLRIIERAVNEFLAYIEKKRRDFYDLMVWLEDTGIQKQLNYRQGHLLKKALSNPGRSFTVNEVKHDYGVSEGTARSDLERLLKLKVLAKAKDSKTHIYISRNDAADAIRSISRKS